MIAITFLMLMCVCLGAGSSINYYVWEGNLEEEAFKQRTEGGEC